MLSSNSEASGSELLENLEEMSLRHGQMCMDTLGMKLVGL